MTELRRKLTVPSARLPLPAPSPGHPDVELAEGNWAGRALQKPALASPTAECAFLKGPTQERLRESDDVQRRALTVIKTFEEDIKIKLIGKSEQK